jgi:hypothetical protein
VHGALLVLGANAADAKLRQHIKDFEICTAGVAKQRIDALGDQALGQNLRAL